jgi:hypothetical protein
MDVLSAIGTERPSFVPSKAGAGRRIRTDDLLITNQLLYQLSYAGNEAGEISARFKFEQRAIDSW